MRITLTETNLISYESFPEKEWWIFDVDVQRWMVENSINGKWDPYQDVTHKVVLFTIDELTYLLAVLQRTGEQFRAEHKRTLLKPPAVHEAIVHGILLYKARPLAV